MPLMGTVHRSESNILSDCVKFQAFLSRFHILDNCYPHIGLVRFYSYEFKETLNIKG